MIKFRYLIIFFAVLSVSYAKSQNIAIPFMCGFEDANEVNEWVINAGSEGEKCQDKWVVDNLENTEGYKSMYISCDTGMTSNYGAKPNVVVAYRPIIIPSALDPNKKKYSLSISFDWKCMGSDKVSMLKFYFLPSNYISEADLGSSSTKSDLSVKLSRAPATATLFGSQDWQNWISSSATTVNVDTKYYMIFVWQNSNTDTAVVFPQGPCIDNIQITSSGCWRPDKIETISTCDTLMVSWEGVNELYEFEYRPSGSKTWRGNCTLTEKHIVINNIVEGAYDIRVRGICGEDKSAWVTKNGVICFCPDQHCINYVDLNREGVVCEIGSASDPTQSRPVIMPTGLGALGTGPVDFGSNDKRSRHTVNWKQGEYDPRTGNRLRTIPEGSLASVRLGNWLAGGQAEGITYDYFVDTTEAFILLMKYAVVLENPGHGIEGDPYFKLEIIDEAGEVIDPNCGEFEFSPELNVDWEEEGYYVWKDWTSIGLNLEKYHGQTIQIRLVTQDCVWQAHCGYAYFTLDCADAAIKSTSCGATVEMEMMAPDGFEYIWTREDNRDSVISTEQSIFVPADDITKYYCEINYIGIDGCGFELYTNVYPRFPYADFVCSWEPKDCENVVVVKNKSHVRTMVDGVMTSTPEKCETYEWSVDGKYVTSAEDITLTVPREGDTLHIKLKVGISDDACQDSVDITYVVPPIYEHHDTLYETLCDGNTRMFDDKMLGSSGVYTEYKKNCWGCDSITVLNLNFVPQPEDVHIYDTICSTEVYLFNGVEIKEAGEHRFMLSGSYGCDSMVFVHLEKIPPMGVAIDDVYRFICADEEQLEVECVLDNDLRKPAYYSIEFDSLARRYGFENIEHVALKDDAIIDIVLPDGCRPNSYTAKVVFEDTTGVCGDIIQPLVFDVYYSSSILQPKFNNLIAVLSEKENGGYTFVEGSYRWYKNNQLIDSLKAFYYLPEGEVFVVGDCYYLEVKRVDDGVVMRTCEICPMGGTAVEDVCDPDWHLQSTLLDKSQPIFIDNLVSGSVSIYSITGQLIQTDEVSGVNSVITAPSYSGIYILCVTTTDYSVSYKIQVK